MVNTALHDGAQWEPYKGSKRLSSTIITPGDIIVPKAPSLLSTMHPLWASDARKFTPEVYGEYTNRGGGNDDPTGNDNGIFYVFPEAPVPTGEGRVFPGGSVQNSGTPLPIGLLRILLNGGFGGVPCFEAEIINPAGIPGTEFGKDRGVRLFRKFLQWFREGAISFDIYIPFTYLLEFAYWNLGQVKQSNANINDPVGLLEVKNDADNDMVLFFKDKINPGRNIEQANPKKLPVGQWFNITMHFRAGKNNDGFYRVYQQGELVLDISNYSLYHETSGAETNLKPEVSVNNYMGAHGDGTQYGHNKDADVYYLNEFNQKERDIKVRFNNLMTYILPQSFYDPFADVSDQRYISFHHTSFTFANQPFDWDVGGTTTGTDEVRAVRAPSNVVAGEEFSVEVDVSATQDRDLSVSLQNNNGNPVHADVTLDISPGSSTAIATLRAPETLPQQTNAYKVVAFLTTDGGSYTTAISLEEVRDISATNPNAGAGGSTGTGDLIWQADFGAVGARGFNAVNTSVLNAVTGKTTSGHSSLSHLSLGQDSKGWYMRQRIVPATYGSDRCQFVVPVEPGLTLAMGYTLEFEDDWYLYAPTHSNQYGGPYPSNQRYARGGKLPGPVFGDPNDAGGGTTPNGTAGSARIMYRQLAAIGRPNESGFVIYEYSRFVKARDNYTSTGRTPTPQQPGRSYNIEVEVGMDTSGNNGFARLFIDGQLEVERTNIDWRSAGQLWDKVWWSIFAGGDKPDWAPGRTCHLKIRNLRAARTRSQL